MFAGLIFWMLLFSGILWFRCVKLANLFFQLLEVLHFNRNLEPFEERH